MNEEVDPASLVLVLSAEYPLVDSSLIAAIVSDYPANALAQSLDVIRDNLGILEATTVPDIEESRRNPLDEVVSGHSGLEKINESLQGINIAPNEQSAATTSASSNTHASSSKSKRSNKSAAVSKLGSKSQSRDSTDRDALSDVGSDMGFTDELEFLKTLFPASPYDTIRDALTSESSLQATIDHLLSFELIRDMEHRDDWPKSDAEEQIGNKIVNQDVVLERPKEELVKKPDNWAPPEIATIRSKRLKRNQGIEAIPLVDTLQRGAAYTSAYSDANFGQSYAVSTQGSVLHSPSTKPSILKEQQISVVSSLATYLSELVPSHSASYFTIFLSDLKYSSLYHAVKASLMSISASKRISTCPSNADGDDIQVLLEDLYGVFLKSPNNVWHTSKDERRKSQDLEVCIKIAGGDGVTAMSLMDLLENLSKPQNGSSPCESYESQMSPAVSAFDEVDGGWSKPKLASSLPGPVIRPTKPIQTEEEQKPPRVIPGAKASNVANATDDFGTASSSPGMIIHRTNDSHLTNWKTVKKRVTKHAKSQHPLADNIPAYKRGITPHDKTPGSLYGDGNTTSNEQGRMRAKLSVEDYFRQVQIERVRKEAAIRAAGRSFAGNRAIKRAIAGHYAREAREAGERIRALEIKAAELVIASQLEVSPTRPGREQNRSRVIDLHHLTVHEAVAVAEGAADKWWKDEKVRRAEDWTVNKGENGYLVIIVGAGRHSVGNRAIIGPAVTNRLDKAGWRIDKGETTRGYVVVHGRK
ncbi:hypothetical protein L204_100271 [Cryptococcus depauperatus]|nr:hypothetical protein L204_02249 [Cryptococcus depauperatus CBS 7855]